MVVKVLIEKNLKVRIFDHHLTGGHADINADIKGKKIGNQPTESRVTFQEVFY